MKISDTSFVFVGNNVAVDFINTEIVAGGSLVDLFQDKADLLKWAHDVNLNLESKLSSIDLSGVIDFRIALKDIFAAKIDNTPPSEQALATINQYLTNYSQPVVLLSGRKNEYVLKPMQDTLTIAMLLGRIAHEAAVLLASPQALRLKRCSNPDCVLIFLDTSRNQQRRWCSMDTCGNRAKVSTHYRKINRIQ